MDDWFHCNCFYHKIKTKVKNTIANRLNNCNLFGHMVLTFRLHIGSIRLIGYHSLAEGYVANVLVDGCSFIAYVWANSYIKKGIQFQYNRLTKQ